MGDCVAKWESAGELKIRVLILGGELFVEKAVRKLVVGVSYSSNSNSNVKCSGILPLMTRRESSLLEC